MGELIPKALIDSARPEFWIPFLETYASYCKRRGLTLDERIARADRDQWYRTLHRVVRNEDPDRPESLRAASRRIAHLADDGGRDRLEKSLIDRGLGTELTTERRSDLELALVVYNRYASVFEEASLFKQAAARDNFWEYLPTCPAPVVSDPSPQVRESLRAAMSEHHFGYGHTSYCDLEVESTERDVRFVFSRGNAHRSHGSVNRDEEREQIDYTPEAHDVVILDRASGRISIASGKRPHVEFARRLFGRVLQQNECFFSVSAIYSGTPLLDRGAAALSTRGVAGLRDAVLRSVTLRHEDGGTCTLGHDAASVFPTYAKHLETLAQDGHVVTAMKLDLLYGTANRYRPVEIFMPNHIIFDRQIAEDIVRGFLVARGFADYGPDHLDLAA